MDMIIEAKENPNHKFEVILDTSHGAVSKECLGYQVPRVVEEFGPDEYYDDYYSEVTVRPI